VLVLIQTKLDAGGYANVGAIKRDLLLMCDNAVKYNKSKSQVHSDALRLRKVTENYEGPVDAGTGGGAVAVAQQSQQAQKPTAKPIVKPTATRTTATKALKQVMNRLVEGMLDLTGEDGYVRIHRVSMRGSPPRCLRSWPLPPATPPFQAPHG